MKKSMGSRAFSVEALDPSEDLPDDDDSSWDESGPDPEQPNWDDFDLEAADDEPDPGEDDFWIDPDEFGDPWN